MTSCIRHRIRYNPLRWFFSAAILAVHFKMLSQKNLSPGNCVAATVFPQEIMLLTINIATVYPKKILSSGKTVARHGSVQIRRTGNAASFLL